jgi:hypothetical protein
VFVLVVCIKKLSDAVENNEYGRYSQRMHLPGSAQVSMQGVVDGVPDAASGAMLKAEPMKSAKAEMSRILFEEI